MDANISEKSLPYRLKSTLSDCNTAEDPMLRLPSELVSAIAAQTQDTDLLAFRLVSRTLASCSKDAFATRFLRHRLHMYTHRGLQGLIDISTHEAFRPYVQSVELAVNRPCITLEEDRLSVFKPRPHLSKDAALAEMRAIVAKVEDECTELFATALRNFSRAGATPALSFQSYPHRSERQWLGNDMIKDKPYGGKQQCDILSSYEMDWISVPLDEDERPCIELCLEGVARAQYPVQDLDLGSCTGYFWWWDDPSSCIGLPRPDFCTPMSVFAAPFADLQALTVAVNPKAELASESDRETFLQWLFAMTPRLTSLCLMLPQYEEQAYHTLRDPGALVSLLSPLKLQSFKLKFCTLDLDVLKSLLRAIGPGLRRFELEAITATAPGNWNGFLAWLAGSLCLEHVDFDEITRNCVADGTRDDWCFQYPHFRHVVCKPTGPELERRAAVRALLEHEAEFASFTNSSHPLCKLMSR